MQFNSLYFILFFIPLLLAAHTLIGRSSKKAGDLLLLVASLFFYWTQGTECLVLLVFSLVVNFLLNRRIQAAGDRHPENQKAGKPWFAVSLVFNIGLLGYFKYTGFFLDNWNQLTGADLADPQILLPVGISFYTFSEIAFAADCLRREEWTKDISFADFCLYAAYFPKLLQGPIALPRDFVPQVRSNKKQEVSWEKRAIGVQMFVFGLAKKVLLADTFGEAADWGYQYIILTTSADMLIAMFAYTFQIYFDFSGYSDMAIGISMLFGYDLLPNFDSPYQAVSITDFWRRWHISLTSFLREYVYFPLGGSRKGKARTYLNILAVFLVSGIWHGANWTFILWGVLHGLLQMAERAGKKFLDHVPKWIRRIVTFVLVSFLWLLFRAPSISEYRRALFHIFRDGTFTQNQDLLSIFRIPGLRNVLEVLHVPYTDMGVYRISALCYFVFAVILCGFFPNTQKRKYHFGLFTLIALAMLFYICLLSLSGVSTFVYNNF